MLKEDDMNIALEEDNICKVNIILRKVPKFAAVHARFFSIRELDEPLLVI